MTERLPHPFPLSPRCATTAAARAPRAAPAAGPNRFSGGSASALAALLALAACAPDGLGPADRSELDNMWRGNLAPKSSPANLVAAFDRFCVQPPRAQTEAALRAAGYVPLPERTPGARGWVVDDSRPAIALSDTMCAVRAKSRSGQTDRFTAYVSRAFPDARSIDPASFASDLEAAWAVPGPAIVATARERDIDFFTYTLIHYTPEAE